MKKPNSANMQAVHHTDIHGKRITTVYVCDEQWKALKTAALVPDESKLLNFEVKAGDRTFLVLDNYGDEMLPNAVMKRLVGYGLFDWNLVIEKNSGLIYTAIFYKETGASPSPKYVLAVAKIEQGSKQEPMRLPAAYRKRVDELKSRKRPYFLSVYEPAVWVYFDHEFGYSHMRENLVVDFHFDRRRIQVWGTSYREVGGWQ